VELSIGTNQKLGATIGSWSREVGPTCPSTCPFLKDNAASTIPAGQRCYAEKIQNRRPSVAQAWRRARDMKKLEQEIVKNQYKLTAIRIHVGGDFFQDGQFDRDYARRVLAMFMRLRFQGVAVPAWFYTHTWQHKDWSLYRPLFELFGVQTFASVHSIEEASGAEWAGWRLAVDPGQAKSESLPTWSMAFGGFKTLTCPEQRGRAKCDTCGFCFRPAPKAGAHVAFFRH
jgi:hypothetical protein